MLFKSMLKTELFKAGFLTPAARGQKIASRASKNARQAGFYAGFFVRGGVHRSWGGVVARCAKKNVYTPPRGGLNFIEHPP